MYAVPVYIFGGIFFRNHNNGADGKLHSLQKNNGLRIAVFHPFVNFFGICFVKCNKCITFAT